MKIIIEVSFGQITPYLMIYMVGFRSSLLQSLNVHTPFLLSPPTKFCNNPITPSRLAGSDVYPVPLAGAAAGTVAAADTLDTDFLVDNNAIVATW